METKEIKYKDKKLVSHERACQRFKPGNMEEFTRSLNTKISDINNDKRAQNFDYDEKFDLFL